MTAWTTCGQCGAPLIYGIGHACTSTFQPLPERPAPAQGYTSITEETIRRIVREEIERALKEKKDV